MGYVLVPKVFHPAVLSRACPSYKESAGRQSTISPSARAVNGGQLCVEVSRFIDRCVTKLRRDRGPHRDPKDSNRQTQPWRCCAISRSTNCLIRLASLLYLVRPDQGPGSARTGF